MGPQCIYAQAYIEMTGLKRRFTHELQRDVVQIAGNVSYVLQDCVHFH